MYAAKKGLLLLSGACDLGVFCVEAINGDAGVRSRGLIVAIDALYRLSYLPDVS
jgi:hypothetical protein